MSFQGFQKANQDIKTSITTEAVDSLWFLEQETMSTRCEARSPAGAATFWLSPSILSWFHSYLHKQLLFTISRRIYNYSDPILATTKVNVAPFPPKTFFLFEKVPAAKGRPGSKVLSFVMCLECFVYSVWLIKAYSIIKTFSA